MHQYRFYNFPVISDIALLEQSTEAGFLRASERLVEFSAGNFGQDLLAEVPVIVPQIVTHGRNVCLRSDPSLTDGLGVGEWRFEVENVVKFGGAGRDGRIVYERLAFGTDALVGFWFIHQLLPVYLSFIEGYHFIHAGSVEVRNGAVIFLAPSEGGKSTLTEFFLSKGHGLISDDKLLISKSGDQYFTSTSHSRYRPYRRYEDLGYYSDRLGASPLPISAIFILNPVGADQPLKVVPVQGGEKFNAIRSSGLYFLKSLAVRDLKFLSGMAELATIHQLDVPRDRTRLEEVYQSIMSIVEVG